AGLKLADKDVFVATVGGIRLSDPSTDLATCLAIGSAGKDTPIPLNVAAIGEVTLSGDVRRVPMINQRISEATRLGYTRILAPTGTKASLDKRAAGAQIIEVANLAEALRQIRSNNESQPNF
ncbi:MAG: S16 family serine protease, partial [Candidatus Nanopelagicales bacterium]